MFTETMTATMPNEQFLSNDNNKERLICMLREKLVQHGYTLIVNTAIQLADNFATVIIIGEDTDLLILLTAKAPKSLNIYVMTPGKGTSQNTPCSPRYFNFLICCQTEPPVLHAISGCDTTSAFYRLREVEVCQAPSKEQDITRYLSTFFTMKMLILRFSFQQVNFSAALYSPNADETFLDKIRY